MHHTLKIRQSDGVFLDAIKEVTRLSKTEIASQALELFFNFLPKHQRDEVSAIKRNEAANEEEK